MSEENVQRLNVVELCIKRNLHDRNGIDVMYVLDELHRKVNSLERKIVEMDDQIDTLTKLLSQPKDNYNDSEADD